MQWRRHYVYFDLHTRSFEAPLLECITKNNIKDSVVLRVIADNLCEPLALFLVSNWTKLNIVTIVTIDSIETQVNIVNVLINFNFNRDAQ